jgi:hypothetical protein
MSIFENVEKKHQEAARKAKATIAEKIYSDFDDSDAPTPLKFHAIKRRLEQMEQAKEALTFYSGYLIEEARRDRDAGRDCNCGATSGVICDGITFCTRCGLPRSLRRPRNRDSMLDSYLENRRMYGQNTDPRESAPKDCSGCEEGSKGTPFHHICD